MPESKSKNNGDGGLWQLVMKWFPWAVIACDIVLCVIIIKKVAYTEIDWIAYMQEVKGFLDGERNYMNLKGDTGPLVYPAGFVYVFSALYWITNDGINILAGQYIFAGFYILNLLLVIHIYGSNSKLPFWITGLLVLSKRVHSIFVLRMFNDCIAVLLGYGALCLFLRYRFRSGCLLYSLGVSIKMNMLLQAPGVLLVLLLGAGLVETVICLSICAGVQLVLALPFLTTFPVEYLLRAFDLGRVFMHKWTVNFKFLPEPVFVSKPLSLLLLALTVVAFSGFGLKWVSEYSERLKQARATLGKPISFFGPHKLTAEFIVGAIFVSNFIGIVFARTLHYQFYCWYFHTLPYLLWAVAGQVLRSDVLKIALLLMIEIAFNVFPATAVSSLMLQIAHFAILFGLCFSRSPIALPEVAAKAD